MIRVGGRKLGNSTIYSGNYRTGGNYLKVLGRDKFCCTLCNDKRFPMVHHLDGNLKNNKMNNLLTVCRQCHAELHGQNLRFNRPNIDLILELREQGKTYQEIGDYLGISRQRVHQIVKRVMPEKATISRKTGLAIL